MKRHLRFLSLLLATVLVVALSAGCSGNNGSSSGGNQSSETTSATVGEDGRELVGNTYTTGLPIVKEPETLKIAVLRHNLDTTESFDEKPAFKDLEAETGIKIEWIEIPASTASERVSVMLAGDLPDVFWGLLSDNDIVKNTESFVPLEDMLEKYAPNTVATYAKIDGIYDRITCTDGHIYTLAAGYQSLYENTVDGIQIINKKWLDAVGKDIPTNMDEFYDVLVAFKTQDPNGNGKQDEIPLAFANSMWCAGIGNFMGSWGFTGYYKVNNGKVEATAKTQEFRNFLEYYHKLIDEGLMDAEGFSQTVEQFSTKIKNGQVGSYYCWTALEYMNSEMAEEYVTLPPMSVPGSDIKPVVSGQKNMLTANISRGFVITKQCKNPAAALRWWDNLAKSTESKLTVALGEQGVLWDKYEDGSGYYFLIPENTTEDFTYENMKYTYGLVNYMPILAIDEQPVNDPQISPASALRDSMVDDVSDYYPAEVIPNRFVDPEKVTERTFIQTDLITYIDNFVATSIINGVTDASWDEFQKQLDALKYDEWIAWYQSYLDGEF